MTVLDGLFAKNYDNSFIHAQNAIVNLTDNDFIKGGNYDTLGGAIFCDGEVANILFNKF